MKVSLWSRLALALLCAGVALPVLARQTAREERREARQAVKELRGKVLRTSDDRFIVSTPDGKEVTLYTGPKTRYLRGDTVIKYSEVRTGVPITIGYSTEGDRYIANTVTLAGDDVPGKTTTTTTTTTDGTVVEGTVVRVVGQDQVIMRTADGKEVIVYVNPQTTYTFNNAAGGFTDIRTGVPLKVTYNVRDQRNVARSIIGVPRRR